MNSNKKILSALNDFCANSNKVFNVCKIRFVEDKTGAAKHYPIYFKKELIGYIEIFDETPEFNSYYENLISTSIKKLSYALEGKLKSTEINILKKYELDYKKYFENNPSPAVIFDEKFRPVTANKEFQIFLGYDEDELANGILISDFFVSSAEFEKFKNELSNRGSIKLSNILIKKKTGKSLLCALSVIKLTEGEDDSPNIYSMNIFDLTELVKKEVRSEQWQFKEIVNDSVSGIFIARNFRFKYLNKKFADIFGYTVDELKNNVLTKVLNAESRNKVKESLIKLKLGEDLSGNYRFAALKKNGSEIVIDVFVRVYNNNGTLSITGVVNEVTEEYEYIKKLEASEEKFRTLTEKAPVGILIYQGTDVVFANDEICSITGYPKDEIIKMKYWELVHPLDRELVKERGMRRQKGEKIPTRYSFRILTKQGETKWIDFTGLLINYEGKPAGIVIVIDITRSKQNKKRIKYYNLLLGSISKLHSVAAGEEELSGFFSKTCDLLVSEGAFNFVLFAVKKESGGYIIYSDYRLRKKINNSPLSEENFKLLFKEAEKSKKTLIKDLTEEPFAKFKLSENWFTLTKVVKHKDDNFGFLTVAISNEFADDDQVKVIFEEICQDLALIIFNKTIALENKRVIEKLRASDERYSNFMDEVSEGIYLIEMDQPIDISQSLEAQVNQIIERGTIAECNDALVKMYGAKYIHEILGKKVHSFTEDIKNVKSTYEKFIKNLYRLENFTSIEKDFRGKKKIFNNRLIGIVEDGFLKRIWGTQNDVTEREVIQAGIGQIITTTEEFRGVKYFKKIAETLKGLLDLEAVLILQISEKETLKVLSGVYKSGEFPFNSFKYKGTHFERFVNKNEILLVEELHLRFSSDKMLNYLKAKNAIGKSLRNEKGELLSLLILYFNESNFSINVYESILNMASIRIIKELERELYEEQLLESRNDLVTILDSTLQAFILIEPDYKIRAFNKLAFELSKKYFSKALSVGSKINNYILGESEKEFKESFLRSLYGEIINKEVHLNVNGKEEWLEVNYEPAINIENETVGIIYSFMEITARKTIEKQLEIENKRNELLFKNNLDGIYMFNKEGDIVEANDAFVKMIGYSRKELLEMNILTFSLRSFYEGEQGIENEFSEDKKIYEDKYKTRNGEIIEVEISQTPVELEGEKFIFRSVRDVTERNRNIKKINQLSRAVENSPSAIIITDSEGVIEYVNPTFEKMTGFSLKESVGKKPNILKSGKTNPNVYVELWETITRGENFYGELINKKKNGEFIWNSISISPIFDEKGNIQNFISIQEDITDKKKILEELRKHKENLEELVRERTRLLNESEERFRRLSENSYDAILRFNRSFNILYYNPTAQRILKIQNMDSEALNLNQVIENVELRKFWLNKIGIVLNSGVVQRSEIKIGSVWIDWLLLPEFSSEGEVENVLAFGRDITERKEYEKRIEEALAKEKELSKLKTNFLSMASHEFRTPLTAIQTTTDLLEMYGRNWDEAKYREQINKINKNIASMIELLEEIFTLSKSEVGATRVEPAEINLEHFLLEILDTVKSNPYFSHDLVNEFNFNSETIFTDAKLLRQILLNLLTNAIKYTKAGELIIFKVFEEGEHILFTVQDRGDGIEEDEQKHIFEPFFRGKNSAGKQGTGLGLAIVKNSTLLLNGEITLQSVKNSGSSFTVKIPAEFKIRN